MRIGFVILVWLGISCNEVKDCDLVNSRQYAVVAFYRADTTVQTSKEVAFEIIFESEGKFYVTSMELDTLEDDTLIAVGLPVNPATNEVNYSFETDSMTFELYLHYRKHLRIYYEECDPVYNFILDSIRGTGFDSVAVIENLLDIQNQINVEIYL